MASPALGASFQPPANWNTTNLEAGANYLNTLNTTTIIGSYVDFTFNGSGAEIYGPTGPGGGAVTCSLEGLPSTTVRLYNQQPFERNFVCSVSKLVNGIYTLRAELTGVGVFGVDTFAVDNTPRESNASATILQAFPSPSATATATSTASDTAAATTSGATITNTATGTGPTSPAGTSSIPSSAAPARKLGASGVVALLAAGLLLLAQ